MGELIRATDALAHRGPDGSGRWIAPDAPIAFGHRRLAVIDLAETAGQPMVRPGPPLTAVTFNGEIYNYRALRAELVAQGTVFETQGDTEVLLHLCRLVGVEEALRRIRGMFAFAFYDGRTRSLWIARDRFGEKPLYFSVQNGTLCFASELRGLREFSAVATDIDDVSVDRLMRRSCIGGDRTIYRDVHKVRPGTAIRVDIDGRIEPSSLREVVLWDPEDEAATSAAAPFTGTLDDAADELDHLLGDSVAGATVSDVPLGAFLSGGVDSTSVVSQLVRRSTGTVKTFTIGFTSEYRSESDEARSIARFFGTQHSELVITSDELQKVIPLVADLYDEPFADSSQIPTYLVAQLTRRDVTVALTGDGGDEMFNGYRRYLLAPQVLAAARRVPAPVRRAIARRLATVRPESWDRLGGAAGRVGPIRARSGGLSDRAAKAAAALASDRLDDAYELLITSFWDQAIVPTCPPARSVVLPRALSDTHSMMLFDTGTYLADDILTKVDRAAMANSLETRVPILTPEIFSFAHSLPPALLANGRDQKLVLKHLLERNVPRTLWDHPKRGFSIPIGSWLRGPIQTWAGDLLSPSALSTHGLLDAGIVGRFWDEHRSGRRDWGGQLWNVLMFQAWYERHHAPR